MSDGKKYDVVVWGATGFTGGLLVDYLSEQYGPGSSIKWAIAGRNKAKLEVVRSRVAALNPQLKDLPIIEASADNQASLDLLAASTRSLAAAAGPFDTVGLGVVEACVRNKTHYADITGEGSFVRKSIDRFHDEAEKKGVKIVHSCGFDSLPADLGTHLLVSHPAAKGGVKDVVTLYKKMLPGKVSGGTFNTAQTAMRSGLSALKELSKPNLLDQTPPPIADPADPFIGAAAWLAPMKRWGAPFLLGPHNARIVRRSRSLLPQLYGKDFRYKAEYIQAGGMVGAWVMSAFSLALGAGLAFPPTRFLLAKVGPSPGQGPTKEAMANGCLVGEVAGTMPGGGTLRAKIRGKADPGYWDTARWLGEACLCMALQGPELAAAGALAGGVLTPASAGGKVLAARLREKVGLEIDVIQDAA